MFHKARNSLLVLTELGLLLIGVAIVAQILFGQAVPWLGGDVIGNLLNFVASIGDAGYVGLIVAGLLVWMFGHRRIG